MVRLIVLYNTPEDAAAFDAHYRDVHLPIVQRYPGLRELRLSRTSAPAGGRSPYYLMAEMLFEDRAALDAAVASDAGRESARDLRNFATGGVQVFVAEDA
ncbi:MAG: EthD family reductase [Chloroflexota bacterium]|nr:EthD family reductase [Chloroflexota bacterium]